MSAEREEHIRHDRASDHRRVVPPMTLEAARRMRGTGWSGDLDALRSNRIN